MNGLIVVVVEGEWALGLVGGVLVPFITTLVRQWAQPLFYGLHVSNRGPIRRTNGDSLGRSSRARWALQEVNGSALAAAEAHRGEPVLHTRSVVAQGTGHRARVLFQGFHVWDRGPIRRTI